MDSQQLETWRKRASLLSAIGFLFCLICLADGLISRFGGDFNRIETLAGDTLSLGERMPPGAETLADLRVEGASDKLKLEFSATNTGFWMGGKMWTGSAKLAEDLPAGEYSLVVTGKDGSLPPRPVVFKIIVYPSVEALHAASSSFITSKFGYSPFILSVCFLGLALASALASFLMAGRMDKYLEDSGQAEVYLSKITEKGRLIGFGLGQSQGLKLGDKLLVYGPRGDLLGEAVVDELKHESATALMDAGIETPHGCLVKRIKDEPAQS